MHDATQSAHRNNNRALTVLVPAFNEAENLEPTIARLVRSLDATIADYELVIVNDGSVDGTGHVADALMRANSRVVVAHNERNMGLGYCYRRGIELAHKKRFVYIPADNTWPERSFLELFGRVGQANIVTSYATNPEVRDPARRFVSASYTRALNLLFGMRMKYFNGLTVYPTAFLIANPPATHGFGFQAETLLRAVYSGLSVVEVGIPIDERTVGGSKAVTLRNVVSVLKTVVRMYLQLRLGMPGRPQFGAVTELDLG